MGLLVCSLMILLNSLRNIRESPSMELLVYVLKDGWLGLGLAGRDAFTKGPPQPTRWKNPTTPEGARSQNHKLRREAHRL